MNKKIAVYGTLLEGCGNHRLLAGDRAVKVAEEVVELDYGMISYGGFPSLVPHNEPRKIHIEVYECPETTYKTVERLEGYPYMYQKAVVKTSVGDADIYVMNNESQWNNQPEQIKIHSGSWREFIKPKVEIDE